MFEQPAKIRNVAVVSHRGTGKRARRGAPLPDREDQPPWVGPGGDDRLGLGR